MCIKLNQTDTVGKVFLMKEVVSVNISCSVFSYTCQEFFNFVIINKEYIPPRSITQHMILSYSQGSKCRASDVIHKCLTNRQVFLSYQKEKKVDFFFSS